MGFIKDNKIEIQLVVAVLLILFGCVLVVMAFGVAPLGIIDNSVLWVLGQILVFSGTLFGVDYHYRVRQ